MCRLIAARYDSLLAARSLLLAPCSSLLSNSQLVRRLVANKQDLALASTTAAIRWSTRTANCNINADFVRFFLLKIHKE